MRTRPSAISSLHRRRPRGVPGSVRRPSRGTTRRLGALASCALAAFAVAAGTPAVAATQPEVTFTLLTPLPTTLAVGETAVIGVHVESSEPFAMAIALSDAYWPGRGVRFDGSPAHPRDTSADLYLTITGTRSTADIPAVADWPVNEDWPAGTLPLVVRAGVRFAGGYVASTAWLFGVTVA